MYKVYIFVSAINDNNPSLQRIKQGKMDNNGNILIKGENLSTEQKAMLKFNGMKNPEFIKNNSFWFKDGKPSTEKGFYYPVCHSLSHLPY